MQKKISIFLVIFFGLFLQSCEKNNINIEENKTETGIINQENDFFDENSEVLFNEDEYEIIEYNKANNNLGASIGNISFEGSKFKVTNLKDLYQFSGFIPNSEGTITINGEEYNKGIEEGDKINAFNLIIGNNDEYLIFDSISFKFYSLENLKFGTNNQLENISFNIYYEGGSDEKKSQILYDILNKNKDFKIKYKYNIDKFNGGGTGASITIKSDTIEIDGERGLTMPE